MNNKAHLRPKDFDSNGDIIPMACKEEKGDLISREALKKRFEELHLHPDLIELINNAPTVSDHSVELVQKSIELGRRVGKAEETIESQRPQGEWQYNQYDGNPNIGNWHCSECKHIIYGYGLRKPNYNFCPYCGIKMQNNER